MQTVGAVLRWLARAIAQVAGYWRADIGKRRTCLGKGASVGVGVLVLCCGLSVAVSAVTSVGQRVGVLPTWTPIPPTAEIARLAAAPTSAPTAPPAASPAAVLATAAPTLAPSATVAPTATAKATDAPTRTPAPKPTATPTEVPAATNVPTEAPAAPTAAPPTAEPPTAAPAPPTEAPAPPASADNPQYTVESGSRTRVDPPYWPCKEGQIKGNNNSNIYHVPTGRDYAYTFKNVTCFDTREQAEAAGFRAAKR